jgi:AAA domain
MSTTQSNGSNRWVNRFPQNLTDDYIRSRVERIPVALEHLGKGTPDEDAREFQLVLKKVFAAPDQVCQILRRLVAIGRAHASEHFRDTGYYSQLVYQGYQGCTTQRALPICVTGHAGVGKSEILGALDRLLGTFEPIDVPTIKGIPNVPAWTLTVSERTTLNHLFDLILRRNESSNKHESLDPTAQQTAARKRRDTSPLLDVLRRLAYRDGVCLLTADEFQFLTQSNAANALITKLLLQLHSIGPRLIYAANFSMIHGLFRRPPQDRDRLLSDPLIVSPHARDGGDWVYTFDRLIAVAPQVLALKIRSDGDQLHSYTYGITRKLVDLWVLAYRMQRERGQHVVTMQSIEKAQRSAQYASHREDVNILTNQSIRGRKIREELWCPFESMDKGTVVEATSAIEHFEERVEERLLRRSLTPAESNAVTAFEKGRAAIKLQDNVVSLARPTRANKSDLLAGDAAFDETL